MEPVNGNRPPEKPTYEKDFQRSVDLFEKSFKEVEKSSFDAQKNQYVKVMKESLSTMQEAANGMLNSHLAELKTKLSDDLNTYLEDPTQEHTDQVMKDIKEIKNSD
jgi:hypothetical protein